MAGKASFTLLALMLLSSVIHADTVAQWVGGPTGTVPIGTAGKKTGDIISLLADDAIAAYCDFGKQIVVTRTSILCVYNGNGMATPTP